MPGKKVETGATGVPASATEVALLPAGIALSLRQPWAALLVHGLKSVEVRPWRTSRRGRIFIHAARTPDPRPRVWRMVPAALEAAAGLFGGIVGVAELVDCLEYASREAFAADQRRHLNDPAWFHQGPGYGLVFVRARPLPFRPHRGHVRFFRIAPTREVTPCPSFW